MNTRSQRSGFTLLELMVVVVIIGLLAAIAIPTFRGLRATTHASTTAKEFRTFVGIFEHYGFEQGAWPADTAPGVVPPGLEDAFVADDFTATSKIGGHWDWQYQQNGVYAALAITDPTINEDYQRKIDALLDDGDLTTGSFQKLGGNSLTYIIEEVE
ncbi:MAG: prepilin-type N-terminal cleavage/methylation domain-containing protein [Puniceicoccaceae bacterium 5H]|nr:MAG: prepilin-type N-terminal cleavage/methylation domain-containing protein [Puniceicoccaceae bacterium 5H]